jgi:FSR family fosmidomycin resistance protein-like MFS transporter
MNNKKLSVLTLGHLATDMNQGALPALLPFLIAKHNFSYSTAASLMLAFTLISSLVQPIFGHLADRWNKSWLIPIGMLMAGGCLALSGLAQNYFLLLGVIALSGIGSAIFHPEAARRVNLYSGNKNAIGMSYFGVGGSLGFTLGPLLITGAVLHWGLIGTTVLGVPVVIVAIISFLLIGTDAPPGAVVKSTNKTNALSDDWISFGKLSLAVIGKSILFYVLLLFIPLYLTTELRQTELSGAMALSLFSTASIAGNLLGGRLADRFGNKCILVSGCALLTPIIPALILTSSPFVAICLSTIAGGLLMFTYGPIVVMAQKYIPNHVGLSSGVTLGVAFTVGGVFTPLIGSLADAYGVRVALASVAVIPVIITVISLTLKPLRADQVQPTSELEAVRAE